ncbi:bactofilin family protein [Litoribrevibacter albus]|uniref:Cell shape determination protein CcmA n=1 Tax=Litoribrevibacter albus TaxID=1473156 RepID=A0AA37SDI2_9GAMM|nr:polymer-forming cytoskeletal protein [Litoribrevibacter albus]GLQ33173.1 cell shape determination protein CcmA [Litoribrevibacter albus]
MWGSKGGHHHWDTVISGKTTITGDVHFTGGLHIDGHVRGNIIADDESNGIVRISDRGHVEGEIRAPNVIINGRVHGNVFSSKHLELAKKASVKGDVYYTVMEMVMGAEINGQLKHTTEVKETKKSAPKPQVVEAKPISDNG